MSVLKHIEFRKQRELGPIISDTFTFLRRNAKPLFSVLVRTCAIPFILLIVAVGFYTKESSGSNILTTFGGESDISGFVIALFGLAIAGILYNAMLYGSTSEYIKAYITQGDRPDPTTVVDTVKGKTGSYIGLGFANLAIVLGIALIPAAIGGYLIASGSMGLAVLMVFILIVPLIFIYVKLSVIYPLMTNKELSIADTIKESWNLVKGEWWMTFFTVLIIGILISIIGVVFQLPATIYSMIKMVTAVQSGSMGDPAAFFDNIYLVLQVLASAINYILYTILAIAINFIYFNLNERKNQSGSLDQIDSIGSTNA